MEFNRISELDHRKDFWLKIGDAYYQNHMNFRYEIFKKISKKEKKIAGKKAWKISIHLLKMGKLLHTQHLINVDRLVLDKRCKKSLYLFFALCLVWPDTEWLIGGLEDYFMPVVRACVGLFFANYLFITIINGFSTLYGTGGIDRDIDNVFTDIKLITATLNEESDSAIRTLAKLMLFESDYAVAPEFISKNLGFNPELNFDHNGHLDPRLPRDLEAIIQCKIEIHILRFKLAYNDVRKIWDDKGLVIPELFPWDYVHFQDEYKHQPNKYHIE